MAADHIRGHLDLLLLSILKRGPAHGYSLIRSLAASSKGAFEVPEGTTYPALHQLERLGLIESAWDTSEGRRRRLYSLTARGRTFLNERRAEWRRFSNSMNAVLEWSKR
jgi:DNA-binding PadR family transcriptional regulator